MSRQSSIGRAGNRAKQEAANKARHASPWIQRLARLGYLTKGIIYIIIGVLAAQAAFGPGGRTTDSQGALYTIVQQPFGNFLLWVVAIGLVGYAVWRLVEAAIDPEHKGDDPKGIGVRLGYALNGIVYGGLAYTAFRILLGAGGGGGSSTQDWTALVLAQPLGRWLVGLAGLGVIGVGIYQIYRGVKAKFREKLALSEMSQTEETWATRAGQIGFPAHGITLGLIGIFLIQAAYQFDPSKAGGLAQALQTLARQPFGPWLLGIVALGLVVYGLFMGVMARYRRIRVA